MSTLPDWPGYAAPMACGHCGFEGQLEHKGDVVAESDREEIDGYGHLSRDLTWVLLRCPNCREPTLKSW